MKNVVLLGDSIRMGYQPFVREQLGTEAYVWAPQENCQHSVNMLLNLWQWLAPLRVDVVHVNAGLWDMRLVTPGGGHVVPLDHYRHNVETIVTTLRNTFGANVIWATTTPVIGERVAQTHIKGGLAGRRETDVALYNEAALDVVRSLDVPVNPLYDLVMERGRESLLCEDGTHFSPDGTKFLAGAVAGSIRRFL